MAERERSQGQEVRQLARSQPALPVHPRRAPSHRRLGRGSGRHEGQRQAHADHSTRARLRRARRRRRDPAQRHPDLRRRPLASAVSRPAPMKWRIGEVTVTKIVELEVTGGSRFILPQATYEEILPIGGLQPDFADERGRLKMSIHALVVETPTCRIIVDTCLGNDKENRRIPTWNNLQTSFLADLAAAGYARETIDTVVCTHLHVDHVGWNTMLVDDRWVPTFPNARYLIGRVEYAHWTGQSEREDMTPVLADSVAPIRVENHL